LFVGVDVLALNSRRRTEAQKNTNFITRPRGLTQNFLSFFLSLAKANGCPTHQNKLLNTLWLIKVGEL